jgi:hypothetical protein
MYIAATVQFIPDLGSDERVNVGVLVGNNTDGFKAEWRADRAKIFGLDIDQQLLTYIEKYLKPLSVEKLIDISQFRRDGFQLAHVGSMHFDDIDEALKVCIDHKLLTNEQLKALW